MIIAISQRNMKVKIGANRDALENDYVSFYEKFGITLLPIPNVSKNLDAYFKKFNIQAIILTGGNSINPKIYGGKPKNEDFSEERDKTEKKLIEIAVRDGLPLFGQCRGAQFINVFFGGSLIQNVKANTGVNHIGVTHNVKIVDKKAIDFFHTDGLTINSYHAHGIGEDTLSNKLKPFAVSHDGIIEGLYHPKYPIAGVLWHPERKGSDKNFDKKLIKAFLNRKLFWEM